MRGRSNRTQRFFDASEPTAAREALERRWADRLVEEPRLATLVTGEGARREPIHRWMPYRQGFSPGLVRLFLQENAALRRSDPSSRVLDPFGGTGTCVVECSRHGVHAVGVEALPSLAFLAKAKFERAWPPPPERLDVSDWERIAEQLEAPIHRAALMLAEARRHTAGGRQNRGAKSIGESWAEVAAMIRDDLGNPLTLSNPSMVGDARRLDGIDDESAGALLTSPPYLSRYDYAETNAPLERVLRFWYGADSAHDRARQVRAQPCDSLARPEPRPLAPAPMPPKRGNASKSQNTHEAALEASTALQATGQNAAARAVLDYFTDLSDVLAAAHRVLRSGSSAWFVVGGARIKDVYVPAELIVAEMAQKFGFAVSSIRVARELTPSRRKFGRIGHVAPRESVIVLTRT